MKKNGYVVDCLYLKYFIALLICSVYFIKAENYTYDLTITAVFRNEARFMKEWIEFHKLVGVQHFYLYNDSSTDNYLEILMPYILKGEVELFDWKKPNFNPVHYDEQTPSTKFLNQGETYNHALKNASGVTKWLAIIDLDEFLFPVEKMNLIDFLKDYEEFGGVVANWVMFGTSNVDKVPDDKLMIECLTRCNPNGSESIKSIVRPERVANQHVHCATYKNKFFHVNSDKIRVRSTKCSSCIVLDKLRINHYWAGDKYRLLNVKLPNRIRKFSLLNLNINIHRLKEKLLNKDSDCNKDIDLTIHKYLDALKDRMKKD